MAAANKLTQGVQRKLKGCLNAPQLYGFLLFSHPAQNDLNGPIGMAIVLLLLT